MSRTRRLVPQGVLVAVGAAALVLVAACQGGTSASGQATSTSTPGTSSTLPATTVVPPPATSTSPATGAAAPPPATKPANPGNGECTSASLRLSIGRLGAAAGHFYQSVQFTNIGGAPCWIAAYPGVSYVTGNSGTQVGAAAARVGSTGGKVHLAPGQMASSVLEMTDVSVFDPSSCRPVSVRGLRVYPPDNTASLYVDDPGMGCAGNPPSPQLRVNPVKAGPGEAG